MEDTKKLLREAKENLFHMYAQEHIRDYLLEADDKELLYFFNLIKAEISAREEEDEENDTK